MSLVIYQFLTKKFFLIVFKRQSDFFLSYLNISSNLIVQKLFS